MQQAASAGTAVSAVLGFARRRRCRLAAWPADCGATRLIEPGRGWLVSAVRLSWCCVRIAKVLRLVDIPGDCKIAAPIGAIGARGLWTIGPRSEDRRGDLDTVAYWRLWQPHAQRCPVRCVVGDASVPVVDDV